MIKHILLDFDHCLATYRCDGWSLNKKVIEDYTYLMNNRAKQIDFKTTYEKNNSLMDLDVMLRYIVSYFRPNQHVLNILKAFKTIWMHDIKISIASDSPYETIEQFMDVYNIIDENINIENYFIPETLNWKRKNETEFYRQIQNKLKLKFDEMILIDDSSSNIELFKELGGQILFIPSFEKNVI